MISRGDSPAAFKAATLSYPVPFIQWRQPPDWLPVVVGPF
jgi:hypothetical protein